MMMRAIPAVLMLVFAISACAAAASIAPVWVLHIDGQIDPATAGYVKQGIADAQGAAAQAVLITMDTPGGSLTSMQDIIKTFFAARVPIIVYVSPNGATAGSAGTFITMAADIAAMAPVSNIGSASPISISPSGDVEKMNKTLERKVMNYSIEYARSIAEKRGRNTEWAVRAVKEAANLTSTNALKLHVIDLIADDDRDLMRRIDGRNVKLATGETVTLHTAHAPFEDRAMSGWELFLHYLSNPLISLMLLMMAMYGIIFELSNPGAILPGVVGGISAILLLYSFSVIPINAAGFAFIALAVLLFIADVYSPTHGVLSVGGVLSLFFGLMMLFRTPAGPMISPWVLGVVALFTGGFFIFVVGMGVRALKNPYIAGRDAVIGHAGEARTDLDPTGKIFVNGALWTATSESGKIEKGGKVDVTAMEGLRLTVRKHEADS
jgi:membrane-bound serine protease (ClpP class)